MKGGARGRERETLRQRLAYWAYRSAERLTTALPERTGRRAFAGLGRLAHLALPGVRATVAANQARVLGLAEDSELVAEATREAFALYARYWFDTFRLRVMTPAEVNKRIVYGGRERLERALEAGCGAITVLPHMGNWDAAGHWLTVNGYRVVSVAEELRPQRLFDLFLHHRQRLGVRIVPLSADAHVGQQLARLLAENWIVGLVADRDLTGRGVEVEMFGRARKLPAGPALLSLSTRSPLMVCPVFTNEDGWSLQIGAPLEIERTGSMRDDVAALTRLMAAEFERAISAKPADWHMFQPAWDS